MLFQTIWRQINDDSDDNIDDDYDDNNDVDVCIYDVECRINYQ